MKMILQGVAGLLLAGALLYWVLHDKDPKALREALSRTSWGMLALGATINLGHNVFRVLRWRWLLAPVRERVPFRPMFVAVILGYMTTWLIPGRIGELVRPALLSARERIPLGPSVGSVVADRLLDGFAIVALFAIASLWASFAPSAAADAAKITGAAWLALTVMVVGLVALTALSTAGARADAWLAGRPGPVRWLGRAAIGLAQGASALRSPRRLMAVLGYSFAAWMTIGVGTWLGVRAAGAPVSYADVLVLAPLLALGVALPTPGGVGGYHALMQFGLTVLFGVDPTVAAGAGIVMHLGIVIPVLVLGPILLVTERISWADIVASARQVREMGHAPAAIGETR